MDNSWSPFSKRGLSKVKPITILEPRFGLVKSFLNNPPYYDEPKLFGMAAILNLPAHIKSYADEVAPDLALGYSGGASLDKERALWKVAGEAIERYALLLQDSKTTISDFDSLKVDALNPNAIAAGIHQSISERRSSVVSWIDGFRISDGKSHLIPTQLIAVPHIFSDSETVWRAPITTGAATASCTEEALYIGLCEVIERDAFMVAWLRQIELTRLEIEECATDEPIQKLLFKTIKSASRYKLKPEFYLLPTGLAISGVLCVLWDETKIAPPLTIGTKASWNIYTAALGALEESLQGRPWLRRLYDDTSISKDVDHNDPLYTLTKRAVLWLSPKAVTTIKQWLSCSSKFSSIDGIANQNPPTLQELVVSMEKQGANVYGVDLCSFIPNEIRSFGLSVAKVVVPEYQPLYLIEELKDYSWSRLLDAEQRLGVKATQPKQIPFSFPHPLL